MNLLLDTHTMLWSVAKSGKLSDRAKGAITDGSNRVFVSSVSFWEIAIKYNLNRLELPNIDIHKIPVMCKAIGFEFFDLSPVDALESFRLSRKDGHRDPFDRMLIHLAIKHSYTLVTCDPKARLYGVDGLEYFW